jgi:uncharacterized Tic20 family protein
MPRHSSQPAPGQPPPTQQQEEPVPPLRALPDAGWAAGGGADRWQDAGHVGDDDAGQWQDDGWIAAEQGSRGPVWPTPDEEPGAAGQTAAPWPGAASGGAEPDGWAGPEYAREWPGDAEWAIAAADAGGGWPVAPAGSDEVAATGSERAPAPPGCAPGDERWAMLGYLGVPFTAFVLPLVIYLLKRRTSPFIRWHAGQALNLAVTAILYTVSALIVGLMLALDSVAVALAIMVPVTAILWLISLGYLVRAAVSAGSGGQTAIPGWLCATIVNGGDQAHGTDRRAPA